jgi:hypothetical protein
VQSVESLLHPLTFFGSRGGIHKKISGLEKTAKKVPRVLQKNRMYQNTQRIFYLPGASPPSPILPILLIPFSSEIDPLGIYRLTFLRHARNSGFTVARGQHLRVPL